MKRTASLLMLLLILSCSGNNGSPGDQDPDALLAEQGYLYVDLDADVNEPDWVSDSAFWASTGYDNRLVKSDLTGRLRDEIILFIYPPVSRVNMVSLAPDGTSMAFLVEYRDEERVDISWIDIGGGDHYSFQMDGVRNRILSNPYGMINYSPSILSDNEMFYLGMDFDEYGMAEQTLFIYDRNSDTASEILLGTYAWTGEREIQGNDFYRARINSAGTLILLCKNNRDGENTNHSYAIMDTAGAVQSDGFTDHTFQELNGADWVDDDRIILAGKVDDVWGIYSILLSTGERTALFQDESGAVQAIYGLNVSPDSSRTISHVRFSDSHGEWNRILITSF